VRLDQSNARTAWVLPIVVMLLPACTATTVGDSCAERLNQMRHASERAQLAFDEAQNAVRQDPSEPNQARVADMAASAAANVAATAQAQDELRSGKCKS